MAEITKELGRIPVSRGNYQSTTEYYKDNIVQYKRGSYQVVSESPIIGVPPTDDKNVVNPGWTLFAGTLDAQDVVNQIKEQEIKSIQAVAAREAEILAKSDAAEVSFDNTGTSISGTNVQDALEKMDGKLTKLETKIDGGTEKITVTAEKVANNYYVEKTGGSINPSQSGASLAFYPVVNGKEYHISIPKTGNTATLVLSYKRDTETSGYINKKLDYVGDSSALEVNLIAENFQYLVVCFQGDSGLPTITELKQVEKSVATTAELKSVSEHLGEEINKINSSIKGSSKGVEIEAQKVADNFIVRNEGNYISESGSGASIAFYPIREGVKYKVVIPQTANSLSTVLSYKRDTETSGYINKNLGFIGDSSSFETELIAEGYEYLLVCYQGGGEIPTLYEITETQKGLEERVADIEQTVSCNDLVEAVRMGVKNITLAEGEYELNEQLLIPSGTKITGVRGRTIIRVHSTQGIVVYNATNVKLQDLTIVGDAPDMPTKDGLQPVMKGAINDYNDAVNEVGKGTQVGIKLRYAEKVEIYGCEIKNFDAYGLQVVGCGKDYKYAIRIENNWINNCYCGLKTEEEAERSNYFANVISLCQIGAYFDSGTNFITSCSFCANYIGCVFGDGVNNAHGHATDCSFTHNTLHGLICYRLFAGQIFNGCKIGYVDPVGVDNGISMLVINSRGVMFGNGYLINAKIYMRGSYEGDTSSAHILNNNIITDWGALDVDGCTLHKTGNYKANGTDSSQFND